VFNTVNAVQVPLELFGGLCTEQPAMSLPMGVSPDCQDMAFVPGAVLSRPGLTKIFATPFGSSTVTYAKSFVSNSGTVYNFYLDSLGNLYLENVTTTPGTVTVLGVVTPGSYCKSITAFGYEWFAFSDGIHGTDVPLLFDENATPQLVRVTQDGPGTPPTVANLIIPPTTMAGAGAATVYTITGIFPDQKNVPGGYFTTINIYTTVPAVAAPIGSQITIAGTGSMWDGGPFTVIANPGPAGGIVVSFYSPGTAVPYLGGGTVTAGGAGVTMRRASNVVTVQTTTPHGLQIGYQAQITGVPAAAVGGGITSIVIDNEDLPGLATITTPDPHGLVPGTYVSINGVEGIGIGGGITSITWDGGIVTVVTAAAHGLSVGSQVTIAGTTNYNTSAAVLAIPAPNTFTFLFTPLAAPAPETAGTVALNWPVPNTGTPYYYEVEAAPTPTTFQVSLSYGDATWTGAAVSGASVTYAWDGTFFVQAVPNATTFQYQQYGPDATASTAGTVTPFGQAAPGLHQVQVLFLDRQGYTTQPSPPVKFVANGGQFLSITGIPTGPPNVVARILAFTGAAGAYFFYIPVPAQVNGQIVSTATQINDNTTTSAVLDFSDNTLFAALGISTQGNNLANQIILDSALGFAYFGSRLVTYGQRNVIQNLLNMGFDGGSIGGALTGWTPTGAGAATLVTGHFSVGVFEPDILQSFYEDAYGAPIGTPNTPYLARAWMSGAGCTVTISSASTGFTSTATLTPGPGGWGQAAFSLPMPATIPTDMLLTLTSTGIVDDLSIIYAQEPFLDRTFYGSYVDNPEAFDGVSGVFGVEDVRKIMTVGVLRGSLCVLTQDPAGRLHVIQNNGVTEPAGWSVNEVAANCGVMSTFALAVSQADDASAGGGEEWLAWMSYTGARIFGGNAPDKISQEIQPDWDAINTGAWLTTWALNDPASRRIYFGLPKGLLSDNVTLATAPNKIYHVDYKNLNSAEEISNSPPIHVTFTGKLAARDHARKWCPWNIPANGGALIYRAAGGPLYTVFFAGNGGFPGTIAGGCGNVFTLCDEKLTDDCLGQIFPYYTTAAFTAPDSEQALQLGGQRKLLQYLQWNADGLGNLTITPLVDAISNPWPITATIPLRADPTSDDEWGGGQASGQRFFIKFAVAPV
jgi:hypothetical protein